MLSESRIKDMVREKEAYLNLLEELDRTGQMRKANYKERVNFTLDEQLMMEFRAYCKENNINMSGVIEDLIRDFLKEKTS